MSPSKVDVISLCTCRSLASLPLSSLLSSFTLTSVTLFPCSLHSCREHQWNITVTLCCDASTHLEEHTLYFLWCRMHTNIICLFLSFLFSSPSILSFHRPHPSCLVSQILSVWSFLSGGLGGQLNIYGSTSIQMFGNGESL